MKMCRDRFERVIAVAAAFVIAWLWWRVLVALLEL